MSTNRITPADQRPLLLKPPLNLGDSSFELEFAWSVRQGRTDQAMWLAMFEAIDYLSGRGEFLPRSISETLQRFDSTADQAELPALQAS